MFHSAKIFHFHLLFIVLTFGAFYWQFPVFVVRSSLAVLASTLGMFHFVVTGAIPAGELVEIPMLSMILVLVFAIAAQRARAEEALRKGNDELEQRVAARTGDLLVEIGERRQAEETLRASEERYRRLVELSFEAVVIHTDTQLVYVNPAGVKLLGAAHADQLLEKSIIALVHPDCREMMQSRWQMALQESCGLPLVEEKFIRLDGTSVDVEAVSIPIAFSGQAALQTVLRDVTPRKQAEQARMAERTSIARELHDSLGQSLGYLHLKLDQIASATGVLEIPHLQHDLVRMRNVANEAYEQVRGMLAALMPANTVRLAKALRDLARVITQHAHFQVQVIERGGDGTLPPVLQQQVLSLCREALTNIAKHANATRVTIEMRWHEGSLTLTITDDGCGFDITAPRAGASFGLKIMEERAAQISSILLIHSQPGLGTELTLQIPFSSI